MSPLKMPVGAFTTKQAMVHATLREAIMDGRLPANERVVIDEVARQLQVSIIPVREAMHQLLSEGLVEIRPHVGPVVTGFDDAAVTEIFTLLECLELAAARHAVGRAEATALRDLDRLVEQMDRADGDRWEELNSRFHGALVAIAAMPRIAEAFRRVADDWRRLYRTRLREAEAPNHQQAQADHRAMVDALRRGDLPAIEAVIRDHNRRAQAHYRNPA